MPSSHVVKCNQSTLKFKCASAFVTSNPMSGETQIGSKIAVWPQVWGEANFTEGSLSLCQSKPIITHINDSPQVQSLMTENGPSTLSPLVHGSCHGVGYQNPWDLHIVRATAAGILDIPPHQVTKCSSISIPYNAPDAYLVISDNEINQMFQKSTMCKDRSGICTYNHDRMSALHPKQCRNFLTRDETCVQFWLL